MNIEPEYVNLVIELYYPQNPSKDIVQDIIDNMVSHFEAIRNKIKEVTGRLPDSGLEVLDFYGAMADVAGLQPQFNEYLNNEESVEELSDKEKKAIINVFENPEYPLFPVHDIHDFDEVLQAIVGSILIPLIDYVEYAALVQQETKNSKVTLSDEDVEEPDLEFLLE
jgi:hypothetical protein